MTPERIRVLYGSIYPAWEYELDAAIMARTGRRRRRQFRLALRERRGTLPSKRTPEAFV